MAAEKCSVVEDAGDMVLRASDIEAEAAPRSVRRWYG